VCRIQIWGEFWWRGRSAVTDVINDYQVVLSQVLLDIASLKVLREYLADWQINSNSFNVELSTQDEGDQKFILSIGRDDRLICSVDKPVCTLSYECPSAMNGCWYFIVDQSCIRMCMESIDEFVRLAVKTCYGGF
jgi:hypothetical protein